MFRHAIEICRKDFRSEIRTRYAVNALLMFIIVVISIIKFSLGEEKLSNELHSGLLWIIIFFSASNGLSRVFISEEERGTSMLLKLISSSQPVFFGKLIFNTLLTFLVNLLIVILYSIISELRINNLLTFSITIFIGNIGLSSAMTMIAALISKAGSKASLYPVLSFPILLPLLITAINATWLSIEGVEISQLGIEYIILFSYSIVVTFVSSLLFDLVWND